MTESLQAVATLWPHALAAGIFLTVYFPLERRHQRREAAQARRMAAHDERIRQLEVAASLPDYQARRREAAIDRAALAGSGYVVPEQRRGGE